VCGSPLNSFRIGRGSKGSSEEGSLTVEEMAMISPYKPFRVRPGVEVKGVKGFEIDGVDKSLFTAKLALHEGKPVRKVTWMHDHGRQRPGPRAA